MEAAVQAEQEAAVTPAASRWARLVAARWLWVPLVAFSLSRLAIGLVAYYSAPILFDWPGDTYHIYPDNILLDTFTSRWDTGFYLNIADQGYRYEGAELPSVAFFPLLPLMMRAVGAVVGATTIAGLIITNLALLGAAVLFYLLVDAEWGPAVAGRAVFYLLIFPTSLFGSAIYSESLFLLLAIGALYLARRGYWESAALLGIAASLTRFMGLLVAPLLLIEWWIQWRGRPPGERPPRLAFLAGLVAPLGTLAYMAYLNASFGDPLAFVRGSAAWARQPESPLALIGGLLERPAAGWGPALAAGTIHLDNWVDFFFVLLFLALAAVLLFQRRWSEGVFVALGVLVPLSSGLWMSQRRYMWVLFPAFILLARWGGRPWVDRTIVALSVAGLAIFSALWANWYWVG